MKKEIAIPEVGKKYHFFDDSKTSSSRHYIAECIKIISNDDAKDIMFDLADEYIGKYSISLYDIWLKEKHDNNWLFADKTDCFVCCTIPKFDENNIWFVMTKDNGWFSLDIQNGWQGGDLDVDNSKYKDVCELYGYDPYEDKIV